MAHVLLGKPVPISLFISRGEFEDSILRLIKNGNNVELIGPNRSGKTAICSYIAHNVSRDSEMRAISVDLLHLRTPRIGHAVASITGSTVDHGLDDDLDEYVGADESAVYRLIEFANSVSKRLVVIIDEMDAGLMRKGIYHEWNSSLRMLEKILHERHSDNISFVRILASNPDYYEQIHMGNVSSKSLGRGYIKNIPALTNDKAREFYESLVSIDCPVDSAFAIKYAGTHPFLIESLAFEVINVDSSIVNYREILEAAYRQSSTFYKDLFDFITRNDNYRKTISSAVVALALRQTKSCVKPDIVNLETKFDLDEMERKDLTSLGVIRENTTGQELFSPLFSWWLSRHAIAILEEKTNLSSKLVSYFGAGDLKTLLSNIKNAQAAVGGISSLL